MGAHFDLDHDEHNFVEWVACGYCWFLTLIMLFYLVVMYFRRNTPILKQRYLGLVLAINLCAIIFVGYLTPFWILIHMVKSIEIQIESEDVIFNALLGFPYIVCQHLFSCLILCRFYLLHYEIKLRFDGKLLDILTRITPDAKKHSWYIRHQSHWGSPRFCFRITLLICIVVVAISSTVYQFCFHSSTYSWLWYSTDTVLLVPPIIGALCIWNRTPSFLDYHLIRREFSIIITCSVIGIFGYIATIAVLVVTETNPIALIIANVFGATIYSAIALTSTLWVLQYTENSLPSTPSGSLNDSYVVSSGDEQEPNETKSKASKSKKSKKRKNHSMIIPQPMLKVMHSDRLYMDGRERPETDVPSKLKRQVTTHLPELTLYDCLANEFGFFAFLSHAFKEYSVENVLATIELQQFQNHYQGKLRDKRWSKSFKPAQISALVIQSTSEDVNVTPGVTPDISPDTLGSNEITVLPSHSSPVSTVTSNSLRLPPQSPSEHNSDRPMKLHAVQSNSTSMNTSNINIDNNSDHDHSNKPLKTTKRNSRRSRLSRKLHLHRSAASIHDLCAQMQHHHFELAPGIPPSAIVFDSKLTMREKIVALCDKYIISGGEFELNLGSQHRMDLLRKKEILQELADDDCASIFNSTIYGIIALMHDSFIRFQQTNSYEQLRRELARNQ